MRSEVLFIYLGSLCRAIRKMKSQSESSLLSGVRSKGENILEIDGTVTTQPVLEHIGISAWPGVFFSAQIPCGDLVNSSLFG